MPEKKASDFRYSTGETKVPWDAVGENYNTSDILQVIRFLVKGEGDIYESLISDVGKKVDELFKYGAAPGKLSLGDKVSELEDKVDAFLHASGSTFIANATAGFEIAYRYANLKEGDEVIIPAITFIATMSYPLALGAKVVLGDVDPRTINLDPEDVERKITGRTKMIVPVHIGGWPVDMDPIMDIAGKHDILVLEDAAHAFGAVYKGRMAGTIGDFGSYSFHEVKNITSFGEGGIVTSRLPFSEDLKKARFLGLDVSKQIKNWLYDVDALKGKYAHFAANNSSATEIQAIGLINQLSRVHKIIEERRKNAEYLTGRFSKNDAIIPQLLDTDDIQSTHHLYLLQIDPEKAGGDIQQLKAKLCDRGITNIPHFAPLYKFRIMKDLGYDTAEIEKTCSNAEKVFSTRFTHLPVYGLSSEQVEYMADSVLESVEEMQKGK